MPILYHYKLPSVALGLAVWLPCWASSIPTSSHPLFVVFSIPISLFPPVFNLLSWLSLPSLPRPPAVCHIKWGFIAFRRDSPATCHRAAELLTVSGCCHFTSAGGILGKLPADPATSATSFTTNQAREQKKHLAGMVTRVCHPDICNEDEGEACHEYKASLDHRVRNKPVRVT